MSGGPEHRAFVAGATGYTGRAVVAALRRRGIETLAHVRPGSRSLDEVRSHFEEAGARVDTTPWEAEAFAAKLADFRPTLVFGLLGITRASARREEQRTGVEPSYDSVDFGLTVLLADACVASGIAPRFVYLSSIGTGPSAAGAYLQCRWKTEEHLRGTGLPLTIARPSFISGDDRAESRPGERVGAIVVSGALRALGALGAKKLERRYTARTGAELASALVEAAIDPAGAGKMLESEDL